jgi:hypothetical protein
LGERKLERREREREEEEESCEADYVCSSYYFLFQVEGDFPVSEQSPHIANIGRMIEDMENKIRFVSIERGAYL